MGIDLTFNVQSLVAWGTLLLLGWRLDRKLNRYLLEHEMLIDDYCSRKGLRKDRLLTRAVK